MKVLSDLRRSFKREPKHLGPRNDFPLMKESELFEANRPRWAIEGHLGEFVLIKGDYIAFFPTTKDAYDAGLTRFGPVDYFIGEVTKERIVHTVPFWLEDHLERADS